MTDRELLEMAAKAVGYGFLQWSEEHQSMGKWYGCKSLRKVWISWRPLESDGDAMRLAVSLKIEIVISDQSATAIVDMIGYSEPLGEDPYAATRRAIVRAAAEIGRNTTVTK